MDFSKYAAAALTAGVTLAAGTALATPCDLVGTYSDSLGSTIKFTSNTKGTAKNPNICNGTTFKLVVTKNSNTVIAATGTPGKNAGGCGKLTSKFTHKNNACSSASGTVTIVNLGSFPDTITKKSKAVAPRSNFDTSILDNGLR